MSERELFQEHVGFLREATLKVLASEGYSGLAIYAGHDRHYFADDHNVPFRPVPHFSHWCPLHSPGHLLLIDNRDKPTLYLHREETFWIDTETNIAPFWLDSFKIVSAKEAKKELSSCSNLAWIGPRISWLPASIAFNPPSLCQALDNNRRIKTPYEIQCLTAATNIAARGHKRIRELFNLADRSEFDIHLAYLQATAQCESELPYTNIIAFDAKAAILHYQHKRTNPKEADVLLADCGARYHNYCADITRTYVRKNKHPVFTHLLQGLESAQQDLCAEIRNDVPFYDVHYLAHEKIVDLLYEAKIISLAGEEAIAAGISKIFFPHGLGHLLGIQTHDVGGDRVDCTYRKPFLEIFAPMRFKGKLITNEVITVEPGIYFIPKLLNPHRQNQKLNWKLIDDLIPMGGMRIEDNVLVEEDRCINFTRKFLGYDPILG